MSTVKILRIDSTNSVQTEQLAESIGAKLRGGEVLELISDLGGGKTTFTRGLVRATGSKDRVASPTFTVNREYVAPGFVIAHYDFYRLNEAGIVADELAETIGDSERVTVIEWGNIVHSVLPKDRVTIKLELTGEDERAITISYTNNLIYLMEGLT